MRLCGVLKDILIVISSLILWNIPMTGLQVLGYSIALLGLIYYMLGYERIVGYSARATGKLNEYRAKNGLIFILTFVLVGLVIVLALMGIVAAKYAPDSFQDLKNWIYYTTTGDDTR